MPWKQLFLLALYLVLSTSFSSRAEAQDGSAPSLARHQIFDLNRSLLLEFVKLARFKANYHAQTNRTGFWRSWIYPLEQETGTSLSFSNTLTDLTQRAKGLNDPSRISRTSVKKGLSCAIAGQTITAGSSSIELVHNGYIAWQAGQRGFSPGKSEAIVGAILQRIDTLLGKREAILTANADMPEHEALELQGKLLRHVRNQLLFSFKLWSVRSREQEWSENTFYTIDISQALCQLTGSMLSYKGFTNPSCVGAAAISNLVAQSLVTTNPIVRTIIGRYIAKRQRQHLDKVFPQPKLRTMPELERDWQELGALLAANDATAKSTKAINLITMLSLQSESGDETIAAESKEIARLHRVADQQALSGPIIGLFGLGRATCSTVAYYGYKNDRIVANRINFGGRISQATGQAYSLFATPRAKIRSIAYQRKLKKEGRLPEQIFQARLKKWDDLEASVKSAQLQ